MAKKRAPDTKSTTNQFEAQVKFIKNNFHLSQQKSEKTLENRLVDSH